MRLLFAFLMIFALGSSIAFAQSKITVGPGVELSIPTGDFADVSGLGVGISGRFQYSYERNLGFVGTLGYVWWGGEDIGSIKYSASALQLLLGPKIYFQKNFYGLAEVGLYSLMSSIEGTAAGTPYERSDTESNFMLSFGAGYEYRAFEMELKYFVVDPDATNLAFRVGYRFSL